MELLQFALLSSLIVQAVSGVEVRQSCNRSTFEPLLEEGQSIENIDVVNKGGSYGEGDENLGFPKSAAGLPELCAVTVRVISSPKSAYRFGIFLPTEWNSRFLTVGNGGFAGGINWLDMGPGSNYGFATISTDTGHNSNSSDLAWALGNEQMRIDWGWRAIHGSVTLGKEFVRAYYGEGSSYSYYSGCSTGGRQGLREIQEFPDSFDGAMIGAPAWDPTLMNSYVTQVGMYNLPADDPKHIKKEMLEVIAAEAVKQCDPLDGVQDGIISAPELCDVDYTALSCDRKDIAPDRCLTGHQIHTINKMYGDFYSPRGAFVWTGYDHGSEVQWATVIGADKPSAFGYEFQRYFVYDDPDWPWEGFNFSVLEETVRRNPGQARAARYDLSDFKARGGKVALYHGMADGLIPTRSSKLYYDRVSEAMGGPPTDFFRYFPVPGMQHCWTTVVDAPWHFAGAFQAGAVGNETWSVPGFSDPQHDMLLALMDWVEKDTPIDSVIATTWETANDTSSGVLRQRPICAFPEKAVHDGKGNINDASSWRCGEEDDSAALGQSATLSKWASVGVAAVLGAWVLWA